MNEAGSTNQLPKKVCGTGVKQEVDSENLAKHQPAL